jgi:pimeloyl-ACP methyl ester carboxylesterase
VTAPDPGMAVPAPSPLLAGFEYRRMDVGGVMVNHAIGGSGPPLLLLHGYPENHLMWRHHWFFLATPNGVPEHMIAADPGFWVRSLIGAVGNAGVRRQRL